MATKGRLSVLLCLIVFLYSAEMTTKKLPSFVKVCKRFDPEVSKCWKNSFESLIPYLIKGIPEFKVPSIEPFFVESLQLNQDNTTSIQFVADLNNVTFAGSSNFKVVSVDADFKKMFIKLQLEFDHWMMNGQYKARGRVLLFQFNSAGKVEGDFKRIIMNATYSLENYLKKGKEHIRIISDTMELTVGSMYIYLHDLFPTNADITVNVNAAINDNIDILYNDLRPLLTTTLRTIFNEYTNRVYSIYDFDTLLPIT